MYFGVYTDRRGEHRTTRFVTSKLDDDRPWLVIAGRPDVSLTKAVASVNKLAGNVYVQLSLAKRNDTIGSVGVGLRYAMEQQAVASAVLFQGVHLVGERLVVVVEGSQLALHGRHRCVGAAVVHRTALSIRTQFAYVIFGKFSTKPTLRCTLPFISKS